MVRTPSTTASSPASSRTGKPAMSATQAAAATALNALLARRRGVKVPRERGVRRLKRKVEEVGVGKEVEEQRRRAVVERNVGAIKKAGKVGEGEREVRRRILKMREEQRVGKKRVEGGDDSDE